MAGRADRRCYACGACVQTASVRCDCGEPLWIETPASATADRRPDSPASMWRYAELLAADAPPGIGAAAAAEPVALDGLAARLAAFG